MPPITLGHWDVTTEERSRTCSRLVARRIDAVAELVLERCAAGRLRAAYPVGEHDVEVRVSGIPSQSLGELLPEVVQAVRVADPECRRVVYVVPEGDLTTLGVVEAAGFRYVVDVDLPQETVSLTVAEPEWVTEVDMDLELVPET